MCEFWETLFSKLLSTILVDGGEEMGFKPPASILETALAGAGLGVRPSPGLMASSSFGFPQKAGQFSSMGKTPTKSSANTPPLQDPESHTSGKLGGNPMQRSLTSQKLPEQTLLSPPQQNQNTGACASPQLVEGGLNSRVFPPTPTLAAPLLSLLESPTPPKANG